MILIGKPTLKELFNLYVEVFGSKVQETDVDLIIETGAVTYRLFGSEERKQETWDKEHPGCGRIYFVSVSSRPVEIWGDVREVKRGIHKGRLVVNPLSLGHELEHGLRIIMSNWTLKNEGEGQLLSPDKYVEL